MRLIDADALKKEINKIIDEEIEIDEKWAKGLKYSLKLIDNAPTVPLPDFKEGYKQAIIDGKTNFSRPKGEWIYKKFDEETGISNSYFCSKCGCPQGQVYINFCGQCGADMQKDGAE